MLTLQCPTQAETQLKNTLQRNVTDKANGKKQSGKHPFPQKKFKADIIMGI